MHDNAHTQPEGLLKLGVSECLLGHPVRYDGGHKRNRLITDTLAHYADFVPVCPEVELGLGVPRESLRLVGDPLDPRLVVRKTGQDITEGMQAWARERAQALADQDLDGFIFKSGSPSSGMERVKVYPEAGGMASQKGVGLFARAFMERFPTLPVEDDGRLNDMGLRENFIERLFAMRRWRSVKAVEPKGIVRALVDFHSREKLNIMAHSPKHATTMGKLVAEARRFPPGELQDRYESLFMHALSLRATPKKHANVLAHAMGYFKKDLTADEKQELMDVIEQHRRELTPLIVPVTLVGHYVRKYRKDYLAMQSYFAPHPLELKLRNHV